MLQYEDNRNSPIDSCGDAIGTSYSHSPSPSLSSSSASSSNSPTPNKFVYSTPNVYAPSAQTNLNQANSYYYAESPSQQAYYNQQQYYYGNNQYYYGKNPNSSYYNDSNYYSRNSSINTTSDFNDSSYTKQMPVAKPQPVPQIKASELKFSIENILGLNKVEAKPMIAESMDLPVVTGKKRKARGKNVDASNKRLRTIFNQEQLDRLEVEFNRQQYMVGSERSFLATSLNLTESQVKIWFQNRRIKWRKCMGKNGGNANANNSTVNDFDDAQSEQSYSDSDCDE